MIMREYAVRMMIVRISRTIEESRAWTSSTVIGSLTAGCTTRRACAFVAGPNRASARPRFCRAIGCRCNEAAHVYRTIHCCRRDTQRVGFAHRNAGLGAELGVHLDGHVPREAVSIRAFGLLPFQCLLIVEGHHQPRRIPRTRRI